MTKELLPEMIVDKVNCFFVNYGEVEKRCLRCGYVIEKTSDDKKNLQATVNSTGEIPKCGIKEIDNLLTPVNHNPPPGINNLT